MTALSHLLTGDVYPCKVAPPHLIQEPTLTKIKARAPRLTADWLALHFSKLDCPADDKLTLVISEARMWDAAVHPDCVRLEFWGYPTIPVMTLNSKQAYRLAAVLGTDELEDWSGCCFRVGVSEYLKDGEPLRYLSFFPAEPIPGFEPWDSPPRKLDPEEARVHLNLLNKGAYDYHPDKEQTTDTSAQSRIRPKAQKEATATQVAGSDDRELQHFDKQTDMATIHEIRQQAGILGQSPDRDSDDRRTKQEMEPMRVDNYMSAGGSNLKAADLQGRELTLQIAGAEEVELDGEKKLSIGFQGKEKKLVLNKTNLGRIPEAYGTETDAWYGKDVIIYPDKTRFQGSTVDCIRVRIPAAPALSDDIPF